MVPLFASVMVEFHSFLIASPQQTAEIEAVACSEWHLSTQPDPSKRFRASADGRLLSQLTQAEFGDFIGLQKDLVVCREIVINAADATTAQNIQQLIYGGILLAYPDLNRNKSPHPPFKNGLIEPDLIVGTPWCEFFSHSDNSAVGCRIAKAAWANTKFIYAIEKLKLSWRLDWFTPHSASPRHGQIFDNLHSEFGYHTDAAFAILAAFSAVEELGLEVRSSPKNPRFLNRDSADWNPDVKQDLEDRLKEYRIDTDEPVFWVYRGEPTEIEQQMRPVLGDLADYNDANVVRDRKLDLVDAIHYCSYLRNFIAAHKFSDATKSISPYDVFNTQCLARRLILAVLGFWRNFEAEQSK
jgi:hypothetical protein